MMNDEAELQRRLRSLGRHDVDPDVAATHLETVGASAGAARRRARVVSGGVAAALVGTLLVAGVGAAQRAEVDPGPAVAAPPAELPPVDAPPDGVPPDGVLPVPPVGRDDDAVVPVEISDDEDEPIEEESVPEEPVPEEEEGEPGFECTGPPPFAGVVPEDGRSRSEEARQFAEFRATQCPDGEDDEEEPVEEEGEPGFECTGPPPFAGVVPEDGRSRSEEARQFAEFRATECPDGEEEEEPVEGEAPAEVGPPAHAGPPTEVGPPAHAGPPADSGRPADPGPPAGAGGGHGGRG